MRRLSDNRGQTTLEFAIIATVLILIVFGIIEGSRIFTSWLVITNEAREAARYGAVSVGDPGRQATLVSDAQNMVYQRTGGVLDRSRLNATATLGPSYFTMQVNYQVQLFASPILTFFPNPVNLTAVSTMRTEDGPVGGGS